MSGCIGLTDKPCILQVQKIAFFVGSVSLSRETSKKKNKIHCEFFSSQADGPMCRPDVVLPEQTSDEEFQVLLVVIKIIVETFIGATVYPLGILGRRLMVFLVK